VESSVTSSTCVDRLGVQHPDRYSVLVSLLQNCKTHYPKSTVFWTTPTPSAIYSLIFIMKQANFKTHYNHCTVSRTTTTRFTFWPLSLSYTLWQYDPSTYSYDKVAQVSSISMKFSSWSTRTCFWSFSIRARWVLDESVPRPVWHAFFTPTYYTAAYFCKR